MDDRKELKFAGFGGQGIVLSGFILGKAVSIHENKQAVLTQSYGPEARGGACSAEVVLSGTSVDYPYVDKPEILVLMSQEAYKIYTKSVREDGIILYDEDLVKMDDVKPKVKELHSIPATKMAEGLGKRIVANIVMLGFLTAVTDVVSKEAMTKSVRDSVPGPLIELNMKAFETGYDYGIEQMNKAN